jgi:arylsulfatase
MFMIQGDNVKTKPNILLLVSDHHRGDWMPYSDEIMEKLEVSFLPDMMPNVKKMMQKGVSFTNCITPSPLCAPARACLASGLNYEHCGVKDNGDNYPVDKKTFYTVLKDAGYSVGGVGKFDLHKPIQFWGIDGWVDDLGKMGFTHAIDNEGKMDGHNSGKHEPKGPYLKYLYDNNLQDIHLEDFDRRKTNQHDTEPTELPDEAYCDNWLSDNGMKMIREYDTEKPWFLQVNFTGPHGPWDITKQMKKEWENVEFPQPKGNDTLEPAKINQVRQNFGAMIHNIDRNIKLIIDEVEKRGELYNTIIFYTADHGDMMGDKNRFGKSVPYRGSVSIPLVVWGKGVRENIESNMMCELQDVASTIVDFCGLEMDEAVDSISLKPFLTGENKNEVRKQQTSGLNDWKMISDGKTKKVYRDGELEEIYDITNDIWELINKEIK